MSRHQKPRRSGGHAPSSPPLPAQPSAPLSRPVASHNGVPPPATLAGELAELRTLVEETRRDVNARLDALAQAMERLAPPAPSPNGATASAGAAAQSSHPASGAAAQPGVPTPGAEGQPGEPTVRTSGPAVCVGDAVYVPRLGGTYTVVGVYAGGEVFKVQAGKMRVQVRRDESWTLDEPSGKQQQVAEAAKRPYLDAHIPEIDLHGFREREAVVTLELFLDHAVANRTPRVRIIHGKGDGILRAAVRRELKLNPLVRQIDFGPQFQGDDGVTLAELDV